MIVAFISDHVGVRQDDADGPGLAWGVESICEQLTVMGCKIAPATYYEHRGRGPSKRAARGVENQDHRRACRELRRVRGAEDLGDADLATRRRRGADRRCTVERLMAELGLTSAVRGKVKRTTISDPRSPKPHHLVNRNFRPHAPDRLWVADFTYVSKWSGWCYTAFVIDAYARRHPGLGRWPRR